jgi:hypothetical protein
VRFTVQGAVPGNAKCISSSPEPAAHSPVAVPEAVSVLAEVMASLRRVM